MKNCFYKGKEARSRSDRDQDVKLLWAHTVTLKHTDINFRVTDSVAIVDHVLTRVKVNYTFTFELLKCICTMTMIFDQS